MKFGKYQVTLSRGKTPAPDTSGNEQGGTESGSTAAGYFDLENHLGRVRNPTIPQIMQMIDNDGTAQMLYSVLTFPAQASDWHLDPDPEDVIKTKSADGTETETHPQAEFIEEALRNPEHKGGMSTPFSLIIADIVLAIAQGYRFFEIVYKLNDKGMVVFKKVVARNHDEIKILTDDTGGFAGVEQKVKRGNDVKTVTIELPYCFLYTYRKERNKLKGASALRPAFYHYDKKHRLYYLQNQQAQVNAFGFKVLEQPDDENISKTTREENLHAVDKMAVRPTIALPFGWKLNIAQPARGIDIQPGIDGHDTQMARSVLAQGMLLGNQAGSSGGSYALADSHKDTLTLSSIAFLSTIEEHITSFLISKLIDYNFPNPLYPTFKFNALSDDITDLLREAFKSLVTKGAVPEWVSDAIAEKVAQQMDIEKPEGADDAPADDGSGAGGGDAGAGAGDPPAADDPTADDPADIPPTAVKQSSKKKIARLEAEEWWRALTAAEAKVKFSKIQKQANTAEDDMLADIKPVIDKISADATSRLKPLLEDQGVKALDGFELKYGNDLQKVFNSHMLDTYSDAKTTAADEINKPAPGNKQSSKDLISQHAQGIADKQLSDLMFSIKTTVTDAVRKNLMATSQPTELSVATVIATLSEVFTDFYLDKESLTASALTTFALNIGRDDVFQKYEDDIYGYQYSAILDDAVCPICEDLDGSVVDPATYNATIWMPPIHFNCRCIWVAIMNDEDDKPDFVDIPDTPGGATAPSLSREVTADLYAVFLAVQAEGLWTTRRTPIKQ